MNIGYEHITPDEIDRIREYDFEKFCRELLAFEKLERHPESKLEGPGTRSVKDGGKDLLLTTKRQPKKDKKSFVEALTEDHIGQTCFSCKTGTGWKRGILSDASKQLTPLNVLAGGGHYTILVNRSVDKDKKTIVKNGGAKKSKKPMTLLEQVSDILWKRLKKESFGHTSPIDRIHIIDAQEICDFLKCHAPSISQGFRQKLGIVDAPGLRGLDRWVSDHKIDRALPDFCADFARQRFLAEIRSVICKASKDARRRVVWIYGPPGVGKTRLVIEALCGLRSARAIKRRILVAPGYEQGFQAIEDHEIFRHQSDAILIVDECSPDERAPGEIDIEKIIARFEQQSRGERSALVLIGPLPLSGAGRTVKLSIAKVQLAPLEQSCCRGLVVATIDGAIEVSHATVEQILYLAEGYPWFAILLAQAVRENPGALPEGASHWDAAELALAPRRKDGDLSVWQAKVTLRAQALVLALLTDDLDWNRISVEMQESYRKAVGASSWPELMKAAEECHERGILRLRQGWTFKYVSPVNLAREVARKLLGSPHWYGKLIRQHAPVLYRRLLDKLPDLELPKDFLVDIADADLNELSRDPPSIDTFARGDPMFGALGFFVRYQPARTAQLLRNMIEGTILDDIRGEIDSRRDLVFALEELAQREESFENAEAALFRLALTENEDWSNSATGVWASLFLGELNATYRTFSERLEILREHARASIPAERILALSGLSVVLSVRQFRVGDAKLDGAYSIPTRAEAQNVRKEGWDLLCEVTNDAEPAVAMQARKIAIEHIRAAVVGGGGAPGLIALAHIAATWSEQELRKLREAIDETEGYERPWLDADPGARTALTALRCATAPVSYSQRLHEAVGSYWLRRRRLTGEDLDQLHKKMDRVLAIEGLAEPALLITELGWLGLEEAQRATPFMAMVGRIDSRKTLMPELLAHVRSGGPSHLLSGYLLGMVKNGEGAEVDALLRVWREEPELVRAVLDIVWRTTLTDERIEWIIDDLKRGRLKPSEVGSLTLADMNAQVGVIHSLIATIAGFLELTAQVTVLELVLARIKKDRSELTPLLPTLVSVLTWISSHPKLGSMVSDGLERGAILLIEAGDLLSALKIAGNVLKNAGDVGRADHGWAILFACVKQDPGATWQTLAPLLETRSRAASWIVPGAENCNILAALPVGEVMAWVGRDLDRSLIVARICSAHEVPLSPVARELLIRFGSKSSAASVLSSRAHSTPRVVTSWANFYKSQLERAEIWALDPHPRVALWGKVMVVDLKRSFESSDAREEYDRRRRRT